MIYNLGIYIYQLGVKLAALFSDKPAKMVKGHREAFEMLKSKFILTAIIKRWLTDCCSVYWRENLNGQNSRSKI
jgi:hypothetical protein